MNFAYVSIGIFMSVGAIWLANREARRYFKKFQDKGDNKLMVILEGLIFTPVLVEALVFFVGVLLVLKGLQII